MGHSFGGYIAGNYTAKFPQHVKRLFLISPVGLRVTKAALLDDSDSNFDSQDDDESNPVTSDMSIHIKIMFKLIWTKKISPYEVSRVIGKGWMLKILDEYME